jgi:hypothetical protein
VSFVRYMLYAMLINILNIRNLFFSSLMYCIFAVNTKITAIAVMPGCVVFSSLVLTKICLSQLFADMAQLHAQKIPGTVGAVPRARSPARNRRSLYRSSNGIEKNMDIDRGINAARSTKLVFAVLITFALNTLMVIFVCFLAFMIGHGPWMMLYYVSMLHSVQYQRYLRLFLPHLLHVL